MKRFLLFLFCGILSHISYAQLVTSQQCLGGNGADDIINVQETNDGGKLLVAESNSTNGTFGARHGKDIVVVKLNSNNQTQWTTPIDDSLGDDQFRMIYQFEGRIYVLSEWYRSWWDSTAGYSIAVQNMMLTSLDMNGQIQWQHRFDYQYQNISNQQIFLLTGDSIHHKMYMEYFEGSIFQTNLLKFDRSGTLDYERPYSFDGYISGLYFKSVFSHIAILDDESLVLFTTISEFSGFGPNPYKLIITKTDPAGNEILRNDTALTSGPDYMISDIFTMQKRTQDTIRFWGFPMVDISVNIHNLAFVKNNTEPIIASSEPYEYSMTLGYYGGNSNLFFSSASHVSELIKMGYVLSPFTLYDSLGISKGYIVLYNLFQNTRDTLVVTDSLGVLSTYYDPSDSALYFFRFKNFTTRIYLAKFKLNGQLVYDKEVYRDSSNLDLFYSKAMFGNMSHGKIIENYGTQYPQPYQVIQVLDMQTGNVDFEYKNTFNNQQWFKYIDVNGQDSLLAFSNITGGPCQLGGADILEQIIRTDPNTIYGAAYIDYNNNHQYDGGDVIYNLAMLESTKGNTSVSNFMYGSTFTKNMVDTGTYETKVHLNNNYFTISPASKITSHTDYNNKDTAIFALYPVAHIHDLSINLINTFVTRLNGGVNYEITYVNNGTHTESGDVKLLLDTRLNFLSANPAATVSGDTLVWHFANLNANEFRKITISLQSNLPPVLNVGDEITSTAFVNGTQADTTPNDNQSILRETIRGSYDPNDKVSTNGDDMTTTQIQNGDYITYVVRFQNIGNDTAFKVILLDTLDANLDWSTFQMVNASHNFSVQVINQHILQFSSNNIMLPPTSVNASASHGFVAYKVKPKSTLIPGDTVKNTAHIYFDYNAPMSTSTVNTRVTVLTRIPEIPQSHLLKIYPNPNNGMFNIEFTGSESLQSISIFDLTGRKVLEVKISSGKIIPVNMNGVASGVYTIEIKTATDRFIQKILLTQ